MKPPIKYILNARDQAMVYYFTELKHSKFSGTVDKNKTSFDTCLGGYGAEVAFCRLVGEPPDLSIHTKTNYVDLTYRGNIIDVKQTEYHYGNLIFKKKLDVPDNPVNMFVLLIGVFPEYVYHGWAFRNELCVPEKIKYKGYKDDQPYCMTQDEIHKEEIPERTI